MNESSDEPVQNDGSLRKWQVSALTIFGGVILVIIAAKASNSLAVLLWVIPTIIWLVNLAFRPEGQARKAARRRGVLATIAWAPLVGPFSIGLVVWGILEAIGSLGF